MSHVLKFPGTKKLDASFPSVLRDSETWNTAREDLQRAMSVSKDGIFMSVIFVNSLKLCITQSLRMKTTPLSTHELDPLTTRQGEYLVAVVTKL